MSFDDKNSLNWLINSDACLAIVPYSLCFKYLKIDPRLKVVFPNQGVPLMWHFILSRSNQSIEVLNEWVESLLIKANIDKLADQGWYLPFRKNYAQSKYNPEISKINGPSKICWDNSWSFPLLKNVEKLSLEKFYNNN